LEVDLLAQLIPKLRQSLKRRDLLFLMAIMVSGLMSLPLVARAESFSVTTTGLLDSAASLFNALWPLFAVVAGIGFGIAMIRFVVRAVQDAFG
jgi:hypothetical protein